MAGDGSHDGPIVAVIDGNLKGLGVRSDVAILPIAAFRVKPCADAPHPGGVLSDPTGSAGRVSFLKTGYFRRANRCPRRLENA